MKQLLKILGVPTIPEFRSNLAKVLHKYHSRGEPNRTLRKYIKRTKLEYQRRYGIAKSMLLGLHYSMNSPKIYFKLRKYI